MEKYELTYKIEKNKLNIRLLGANFFQRNKTSGIIIYERKIQNLKETMEIKDVLKDEIKKI